MGCLRNVLRFIFGGCISNLSWLLTGCLWCIDTVGIPAGMQCSRFTGLSSFPSGREVVYGGGVGSLLLNVIWLMVSDLPLVIESAIIGALLCMTIVGIPFGLRRFRLTKLALIPFGSRVM